MSAVSWKFLPNIRTRLSARDWQAVNENLVVFDQTTKYLQFIARPFRFQAMKTMLIKLPALCLLLSIALCAAAFADEIHSATCAGETLQRNGTSIRTVTVFGIEIYRGSLYVTAPSSSDTEILNSKSPKLMRFEFLKSASESRLRDGWREGLKKNSAPQNQQSVDDFVAQIPAVNAGTVIEFCIAKDRANISVDGKPVGSVQDPILANSLLSVWLGSQPPNEKFKHEVLTSR